MPLLWTRREGARQYISWLKASGIPTGIKVCKVQECKKGEPYGCWGVKLYRNDEEGVREEYSLHSQITRELALRTAKRYMEYEEDVVHAKAVKLRAISERGKA